MKFYPDQLVSFVSDVLQTVDLSAANSYIVAESLVSANVRGVDSHGVTRVPIYIKRLKHGIVTPNPDVKMIKETNAATLIDGDDGMGQIVAEKAVSEGVKKAKEHGSANIAVTRSTHFGAAGYFVKKALEEDVIAFAMSNAPANMAPWGGVTPYFGTNPYSYGIPASKHFPIVFDMATSVVARGKIISAEQRGEDIPEGWAIDKKGRATTDAKEALEGTVLPFGGPKGYAMAAMIDIMSGVLSGAGFGPRVRHIYGDYEAPQNVGHFFQFIDVNAFMPAAQFKQRVDQMIEEIKETTKAENVEEIFLPGEIESRTELERKQHGFDIGKEVYEALNETGKECGVNIEEYH
ncbi:Ldh family oxidoreductase [Salibacterium aidingense]|uniref:Ldh family oxidoreductase n=1 Tax=Salibacterium aidingense TaxID=384933 RepID=UPI000425B876|nr:Ldh family oxidoreductase [Salibacterium aidingense]